MTDEEKTVTAPIPPHVVTIIGTGTGDGGSPLTTGTTGKTPDHQPDLVVNVVQPAAAIAIRFANAYLTTLVGLISAGMVSHEINAADFTHLVLVCARLSLAGPALALLKDCLTIFSRLEAKYPLLTGSV